MKMKVLLTSLCSLLALLFAMAPLDARAQAATSGGGSISGNVFADSNGDAKADDDEEKSAGQTVKLYRVLEDGSRVFVVELVTGPDGDFNFAGLPLADYVVTFEFTSGVIVETASVVTLTPEAPSFVLQPIPALPENYQQIYGNLAGTPPIPGSPLAGGTLDALGLRNPANLTGEEVSRFVP